MENNAISLQSEAEAFLEAWRAHPESDPPSTLRHKSRVAEIVDEIEATGTYTHTPRELEFGARLAWKNSNRCIGRHLWRSLEVRDHRSLHNGPSREEHIIDTLTSHVRDAYRNGKIKSIISVFAPRTLGQPDPVRMANHQLIRYAGFEEVGDPDSRDLTKHLLKNGWKPVQKDDFTKLPWQFYWDEKPSSVYDVFAQQTDLAKEVNLEHPENPKFASLQLKWYALPVLADMALKIGGVIYPFAPFNGYYMGTEIGARNLADASRYNRLPAIAACLGLDTTSQRSLWQDSALVELNRAVLYSFDKAGISVGDHHNLGAQFEAFCTHESGKKREVKGDWSWLNPPLSGPQTPQFHRQYDNTVCTHTNFFYQAPLWQQENNLTGCPFHL